jgi:hypothetical protein
MSEARSSSSGRALAVFLLAAGLVVLLAEAACFARYGTSVYDEGGYLYEGWLTVRHGWVPFLDFYAKIPPLIYYLYGAGQSLFGPDFYLGRLQAAAFTFFTLALAILAARRLGGKWAAVIVVWLPALCPAALSAYFHAYAMAPTSIFLVLALSFLTGSKPGPWPLLAGMLTTAAFLLCRHDLLPFALVLWVYVLTAYPLDRRQRFGAVIFSWACFALVMMPFALLAPGAVLQTLTIGKLGQGLEHTGPMYGSAVGVSLRAVAWHTMMVTRYYGAMLLLALPALAAWLASRRDRTRPPFPLPHGLLLWLFAPLVNWLAHIPAALLSGNNIFYLLDMYIYFPLAVFTAVMFVRVARGLLAVCPQGQLRAQLATWACAALLLTPALTGPGANFEFKRGHPTAVEMVQRGGQAVARYTSPRDTIFTLDDPHHFLQAGRLLPNCLTHELFGYVESTNTPLVRQLHHFNKEMIAEWLSGQAQVVILSHDTDEFMVHSGRFPRGQELHDFIYSRLQERYRLVAEIPGTYGGPMRIYRLAGTAGPAANKGNSP